MQHVIWDWNGTLLDDLHVVIDAVNETVVPHGVPPITAEDHATLFTRPVSRFYERMLKRSIDETEWRQLDDTFHASYARGMINADLTTGAREALASLAGEGRSQSLLSMAPHDHLLERVQSFDVGAFMIRIDGLRDGSGALKRTSLAAHLNALIAHPSAPDDPNMYVIIGDSVDDAAAATANGVRAVMFASGSHHRRDLVETGFPVVDTLDDAIELVRRS